MAEFKISRIRYTWKNTWQGATQYNKDDIVSYNGSSYIAIRAHTSSSTFNTDQIFTPAGETLPTPAWIAHTQGQNWRSDWAATTDYYPGDIVRYGGYLWINTTAYTSTSDFDTNISNWAIYATTIDWDGAWAAGTKYGIGDLVKYGPTVYKCITGHTAAATATDGLELDQAKWAVYSQLKGYVGDWVDGYRYKYNELVSYGGSLLRVTVGHTATTNLVDSYFALDVPGGTSKGTWVLEDYYAIGDVVMHGGYVYQALTNHIGQVPSDSIYQTGDNTIHWAIISKGKRLVGDWTANNTYKSGDVVRRGGYTYVALLDTTSDGSSLDYLDAGNWEIVVTGQSFKNAWTETVTYAVGDVVTYKGSAYKCNFEHVASNVDGGQNFPGDNGEGYEYWDTLLEGSSQAGLVNPGDLLSFGLARSNVGDGSTLGSTNIPKGTEGNILTVQNDDTATYERYGKIAKIIHVDPIKGIDDTVDPDAGIDIQKPVKTIRFALEIADDGEDNNKTVQLSTGKFEEILPLIVPKKTVVLGDELRSSLVRPATASLTSADTPFKGLIITRLKQVVRQMILNQTVTKTAGNALSQVFVVDREISGSGVGVDEEIITDTPIFGTTATADRVDAVLNDFISYYTYAVAGTGDAPAKYGENDASTDEAIINSRRVLEANKLFLSAEVRAYIAAIYPEYVQPSDLGYDIERYVIAINWDLLYVSNYKTQLEAVYYSNKINGSALTDMFRVRDTCGVRNLSIKGLTGSLNPPNVFEQYQRPTGPSCISLDPGWGPAHEECWIVNRSPYIQNVTNQGDNCTGQKIDGSLHNGGNKSIVSNDFTQVLSDGIGAHVLNNGRAELVSVFTYYCQVGYLAENGGVIRATNGNNSYGFIGALADGTDPTEVPILAKIDTQSNQASVQRAFAGEVNDEILAIEFLHCGQNYTSADYTFIGSGADVEVKQEEYRDDALFEARIVTGDASAAAGGGGFTLIGNNAQSGNETSIQIATQDDNEEANLLGLRIIITSGPGTGQYGEVKAYNSLTKQLQVKKETTGEDGWDHIIPGTPPVSLITTTSAYLFEPRVVFDAPPFASAVVNLTAGTTWGDIEFGETRKNFTNVVGDPGNGTTVDIIPATATFNVLKEGKDYTVTLNQGGAGYTIGDVVVLEGDALIGNSDNNITLTVTSISNDSTNSIVTFKTEGTAASGRYVAVANTGATVNWSNDGTNWNASNLPSSGNWKTLATGNNRFVTIKEQSNEVAVSEDGETWIAATLPISSDWSDIAFGNGIFVAVSKEGGYAAFSETGTTWTLANIPAGGDSTFDQWNNVAFGANRFVAVAQSQNIAAHGEYNGSTIVWTTVIMDVIADSSQKDWFKLAYGNNRFVAIAPGGEIAYSYDRGTTWRGAMMPTPDGSTILDWNDMKYGQGLFVATVDTGGKEIAGSPTLGPVDYIYQSEDGIYWTKKTVVAEGNWGKLAFGNPDITLGDGGDNRKGHWVILNQDVTTSHLLVTTGRAPFGRANVLAGRIASVNLIDPGSGYPAAGPTYTVVDPNNTGELVLDTTRIADRVLAQPSWINRGTKYKTSTTTVSIIGDGFADITPVGKFLTVKDMPRVIGPGAQLRITDNPELYTVVAIENEGQQDDGNFVLRLRVTPDLKIENDIVNNTVVTLNTRYSQCRITGHDYLDVGTGNFADTNYPSLYTTTYLSYPENEVQEFNGGRVFYASTDQSGNFRCGELFAVEQATGIVTISADFFDLNGLSELALGGIRVGGTGTVIREFSTDPLFTADSNNIVPTQRAIKAYLTNRLNVGGADLLTASFIAGTVKIGPNLIGNSANLTVQVPVVMDFKGEKAGIQGSMLAQTMFFRSFKNRE
jgi:hypothetical protein